MPSQITSPTPQPIVPTDAGNWAPIQQLKEIADRQVQRTPNSLCDALKSKYQEYVQRDYSTFVENCETGRTIDNLRAGKLLLMRSIRDGSYMWVKREGRFSNNKTVSGKFQFYWTKLEAEWFSSNPELDPVLPDMDDQVEEYIANVKIIEDYYTKKFYTLAYKKDQFANAAQFGTYISLYRFCDYEKDLICKILPFPACRWDIRFTPEESAHFLYESKEKVSVLEELLGGEVNDDDGAENIGLRIIEQMARTGGNITGYGKERPYGNYTPVPGEAIVTEMWLQPSEYCDIKIDRPTKTVGGQTIPEGESLVKLFPKGMVVIGINQMEIIWAIHAENHQEHIVSGVYHAQSSGVGKGLSDAVDAMKDLNDLHSQLLTHVKTHSTPGWGYIEGVVSEEMARNVGKPDRNIPFNLEQFPDIRDINQAVKPLVPSNPAMAGFQFIQRLEENVQTSMQVTEYSTSSDLGINSKTATGDKIRDANAEVMLVSQHLRKADAQRRGMIVAFNLFKKYVDIPKWFRSKSKNAITSGKYLSGEQFDDIDVDFEIVSNSQIPQTPYQQRDALTQILQYTGGIAGLIQATQMNPEMTGEIVAAYGGNLTIPNKSDIARVCRRRIEQAKQILEGELQKQQIMSKVTGEQFDNANLATTVVDRISPPMSPYELYATQKIEWMADLLDSDEFQYAPPELRYVIEEMISRQLQTATFGAAEQQFNQDLGNVVGMLPSVLGEQSLSTQAQQIAAQAQSQQQQQAMAQSQLQQQAQDASQLASQKQAAEIQETQASADHDRQLAENAQTHRQALQLKSIEHLSKMEQIKNAPKPTKAAK